MSDHVSQPTALRLQAAGWKGEIEFHYSVLGRLHHGRWIVDARDWLPAPNVTEIGEELNRFHFRDYWISEVRKSTDNPKDFEFMYSSWLYSIMHNANELAKVWLWKEGK